MYYQERKIIKNNLDQIINLGTKIDWFNIDCKTEKLLEDTHEAQSILNKLENRTTDYIHEYNKFVDKCNTRYVFLQKVTSKKIKQVPSYFG
jgi:hypothetical protein